MRASSAFLRTGRSFILGGEAAETGKLMNVTDKFTGAVAGSVHLAGPAELDRAAQLAHTSLPSTTALPAFERKAILRHLANRLNAMTDDIAVLLAIEAGKPVKDARVEVTRSVETFELAAEACVTAMYGQYGKMETSKRNQGLQFMTRRFPIGPVSMVTPFNFPLMLAAHKVAPAIAAGCPFVLKPSDYTPFSALVLGDLVGETSWPKQAMSIVPCLTEHAKSLSEDPRYAMLSFTGSPKVGWALKAASGKKKVTLELGGAAPCLVDADTDIARALDRAVFGAYYQSGQSCISVQRFLVHESIYARFRDELAARVSALKSGDPLDEQTYLGPVISEREAERIHSMIKRSGGKVLCGGNRLGVMVEPTLIENPTPNGCLAREEVFGPVATIEPFTDFKKAVHAMNDSPFGLQAGVFTLSMNKALYAFEHLHFGGVVVNDVPSMRADAQPYGGVKDSGFGREGIPCAIEDMTEIKVAMLRDCDKL